MSDLEGKRAVHAASMACDAVLAARRAAKYNIDLRVEINSQGIFMDKAQVRVNLLTALIHIQAALQELEQFGEPSDSDYDSI